MEFEKLFTRQRIQCGCQLIVILLFPKPLLDTIYFTLPSKWPSGLLFQSTHDFVMSAASAGQSMNVFFKDTMLPFFLNHIKKRKTRPNQQTKNGGRRKLNCFPSYVSPWFWFFYWSSDIMMLFFFFWLATSFYQVVSRKSVLFRLVLPSFFSEMFSSINWEEVEKMYISYDSWQVNYIMC